MNNHVRFMFGTQAQFDALEEKDSDTLYFISDTQKLILQKDGKSLEVVGDPDIS